MAWHYLDGKSFKRQVTRCTAYFIVHLPIPQKNSVYSKLVTDKQTENQIYKYLALH